MDSTENMDAILGGSGNDEIRGGKGLVDVLIGDSYSLDLPNLFQIVNDMFDWKLSFELGINAVGTGNNKIFGEEGLDFIIGGSGNDRIDGGEGVGGLGGIIFGDALSTGTGLNIEGGSSTVLFDG